MECDEDDQRMHLEVAHI
nr:hypothetical protein [Tanacetum cinerariifolium]